MHRTLTAYLATTPGVLWHRAQSCRVHRRPLRAAAGWRSWMDITPTEAWMDVAASYPGVIGLGEHLEPPRGGGAPVVVIYCPDCDARVRSILLAPSAPGGG